MAVPSVYDGLIPKQTNGGLTSLQLALANDMATGQLPFGVNLDFLAAMRTYCHSDPLLPIDFENQGQQYAYTYGYKTVGIRGEGWAGINLTRKGSAPDIARNLAGVSYTIRGDDIFLLRRAPDCGPDENIYEQVFIGKKATIAAGSFAYYGKKVIFNAPMASGSFICCFIQGTKITMASGEVKNIEDVTVGEQVIGKDNAVNTVINYIRPVLGNRKLVAFNNGVPFMTSDHPVYTKDGWKSYDPVASMEKYEAFNDNPIKQLMPGDTIETVDGQGLYIESMQTADAPGDLQVYNFELDGNNTYVANNLIVHNKGISASCSSSGSTGCSAGG